MDDRLDGIVNMLDVVEGLHEKSKHEESPINREKHPYVEDDPTFEEGPAVEEGPVALSCRTSICKAMDKNGSNLLGRNGCITSSISCILATTSRRAAVVSFTVRRTPRSDIEGDFVDHHGQRTVRSNIAALSKNLNRRARVWIRRLCPSRRGAVKHSSEYI